MATSFHVILFSCRFDFQIIIVHPSISICKCRYIGYFIWGHAQGHQDSG
jgi:hypothetical protein